MKKIIILLSLTILLLSCSSNDSTSTPSTANTLVLPKKITEISYHSG